MSKETIMHLPLLGLHVCVSVDLSRAFVDHPVCGSLACISGLCVCMWSSHMHLWIVCANVDLSRAFVDHPVCGSLVCISGLCVCMWSSHMHLWIVCASVDLSRAFVDCVRECGSLACICGLCAQVWISRVHLWEDLIQFSLHIIRTNWMLA